MFDNKELTMELAIIVIIMVLIALYYGLGQNLEVSSRMLTRELEDAECIQKVRIVKGHNKSDLKEEEWKKAVENINKIDELDI